MPHLTPLSVHLAGCGEGKARPRSHRLGTGIQLFASLVWMQKTNIGSLSRPGPRTTPRWEQPRELYSLKNSCEEELSILLTSKLHFRPAHFVQSAPIRWRKPQSGSLCARSSEAKVSSKPSLDPACSLLKHLGGFPSP